ncbi:nitroreductase/quinone reductase family protein [Nocardiopsis sp. RSe5-2]|uniref:Nitroreductase/quinone reductase family protein n=1 Tax=Nocardiopsis endophytica TaxID=3018445 RepID=A0ABT4TZN9_9ACTN|nr:nitroreductase/quinone reductase family protein [Nocardiopsis endophytica]MDA2810167.1 nitroreductase/quinone reductase family protein [Nocardiopsis endophytica]
MCADHSCIQGDATITTDFNQQVIDEYRATRGRLSGPFANARLLLLTTTGARTGLRRTTPLGYLNDEGGRILVIASAGGSTRHPAWYRNLVADPRVTVESGPFTFTATAEVLEGEERDRVFARAVEADAGWGSYQEQAGRTLPVVALHPVEGGPTGDPAAGDFLVAVHDAFRRELELVRDEVASTGTAALGAQLRINCMAVCQGLHHHHTQEDEGVFPAVAAARPDLAPVVERLRAEHVRVAELLAALRERLSDGDPDTAAVLADVDRLTADLLAHLDYEERELVPLLNAGIGEPAPEAGEREPSRPRPDVERVRATDRERDAVRALMTGGALSGAALPGSARIEPLSADTGGVPCDWVDADGAGLDAGVVLYAHGGGFEFEHPAAERVMAHRLSLAAGRPAVRVGYRLAPAHPFPAAVEDVAAVYRSLVAQGVPPGRIVLAGESAGATLVLSALLLLKEAGDPLPAGAVSVSPVTDFAAEGGSRVRNEGRDLVPAGLMAHIGPGYLNGAPADEAPQSPLYGDLSGLPPLLLVAGEDELLLDDAVRFAEAAAEQGTRVALDLYEGMPHVPHMPVLGEEPRLKTAETFLDRLAAWVRGLEDGRGGQDGQGG